MALDKDALFELLKNKGKVTHMIIQDKNYALINSEIAYSDVPVSRPTTRGGVYFSDTMAFKLKAQASDVELAKVLPKTMLGPNTEFAKIELIPDNKKIKIFANLTNYVQKSSGFELNLTIIETESAK